MIPVPGPGRGYTPHVAPMQPRPTPSPPPPHVVLAPPGAERRRHPASHIALRERAGRAFRRVPAAQSFRSLAHSLHCQFRKRRLAWVTMTLPATLLSLSHSAATREPSIVLVKKIGMEIARSLPRRGSIQQASRVWASPGEEKANPGCFILSGMAALGEIQGKFSSPRFTTRQFYLSGQLDFQKST